MVQALSPGHLFATQWTVAPQAPLSMGFSRQEYWSGLPFPPPGDSPNPGIEPARVSYVSCVGRRILYHCTTWESTQGQAQIGVLPEALAPCLPTLLLSVYYLLDCHCFLPEVFFFFNSVEVFALPLGVFRFRRLFDLEPWAFLFFITVGTALPSSSHIRVI